MNIAQGDFLEESVDFFLESLKNWTDGKWKFAILHSSMAVEMLLKESLVGINSGLVLENIDDPKCKTTVGMRKMLHRLEALNIRLDDSDKKLIEQITDWRNDIAHRKLLSKKEDVEKKFPAIYKFFSRFLRQVFELDIESKLSEEDYEKFKELLEEWEVLIEKAQDKASEAGAVDDHMPSETFDCPECWSVSDTVAIVNGKAHCFLCNEDFEFLTCSRCDEPIIGEGEPEEDGPTWCEACSEHLFGSD